MNWHQRYLRQAAWTRNLRSYLFERCGYSHVHRALEVGCGTGAVLADLPKAPTLAYGLELDRETIEEYRVHAHDALLTCGDALWLPYANDSFEITFCHFLLLWLGDPLRALREMKRVTAPPGYVIAFAEPDYGERVDRPQELAWLGQRQNEALARQGAALRRGVELAAIFQQAGIHILETGMIRPSEGGMLSVDDWESEWQALGADLDGNIAPHDLERLRQLDRRAMLLGKRVLHVPTYFVWGQV
jgi:ubiquinone/menaquinone biosynthesis C-methylase UbiE